MATEVLLEAQPRMLKRPDVSTPSNGSSRDSPTPEFKRPNLQASPSSSSRGSTPARSKSPTTTKRRWSKTEDEKLCAAVKGVGLHDWKTIADVYMKGHELSDAQCMHRWQKVLRPGLVKGAFCEKEDKVIVDCLREGGLKRRWTKQEDEKLCTAVKSVGTSNWKQIAEVHLAGHGRSEVQCLHRWQKVLRAGLVKGAFTEEEDKIIIECMRQGGLTWMQIAERIPGRIGKQCRERWTNHLDPNLKKGGWTHEEDTILAEAQQRWGNAWTKIAKLLPGRAENAVKNRWNSAFRRKKSAQFGKAPSSEEDTAAIARARLAMEMIDRDEREPGAASSTNGDSSVGGGKPPRGTKRSNSVSSCSNSTSGSAASNGGGVHQEGSPTHRARVAVPPALEVGPPLALSADPVPRSCSSRSGHKKNPVVTNGGERFSSHMPGPHASSNSFNPLTASASSLPLRGSASAGCAVQARSHHHPVRADPVLVSENNHRPTSPTDQVLDLFRDFSRSAEMDDGLLSLDDDHDGLRDCDLDVSLDNLDVAGVDPSDLAQAAALQVIEGTSFLTHHTNGQLSHTNGTQLSHGFSLRPLATDDDIFYSGRTGLTPSGPLQKTPSGMLSGLSPHDGINGASTSFSPFGSSDVVSVNALACGVPDDDLAIDLPAGVDVVDRFDRHGHLNEFMSPNGTEYQCSWGLPAPELKIPSKVSKLLSTAATKGQPLLRNLSSATDVTVDNTSPVNIMDGPPPAVV